MSYTINLGQWNGIFAVPTSVVDNHIKLASEAHLKVLLYLLRHSGKEVFDDELSKALNISAEEAANAVSFWIERDLLTSTDTALTPSAIRADALSAAVDIAPKPSEPQKKPHTVISRAQRPDPSYVASRLKEDTNLAGLMEHAQSEMKKPLSPGDMSTLVMLYDSYGMPCDVIAMLITYLSSSGDANMRQIEKICTRWSDDGIKTTEEAEKEIGRLDDSKNAWGKVSSLLGIRNIGRPTKAQMEHAYRWLYTWSFNDEMITEAYERCVNTKGEYNIRYINGILQKWFEKNIKSLDRLHEEEAQSKKKPRAGKTSSNKGSVFSVEGASFDINKFEDDSLFDD